MIAKYCLTSLELHRNQIDWLLDYMSHSPDYEFIQAGVCGTDDPEEVLKSRRTTITSVNNETFVVQEMEKALREVNDEFFHFPLTGWQCGTQATYYTNAGDKYDWHRDGDGEPEEETGCRRLSISLVLSDPEDYEGGEFEIKDHLGNIDSLKPAWGTAIIFPSTSIHRVKPIISGERISFVNWMNGLPISAS